MSKVTSKLQVTVPKAIADEYKIRPGDEILWVSSGESIRVIPPGFERRGLDVEEQLELFDAATRRQREREERRPRPRTQQTKAKRDWTREDLYGERGRTR